MSVEAQKDKFLNVTPPAAAWDNATVTANVIDTLGYDYCRIIVSLGAIDTALTGMKVQESDTKSNTTALTSGADVTGLVYGTSNGISGSASALPSSTTDNNLYAFEIDCRQRKRYLLPVITVPDGTITAFASIVAQLSRAKIVPVSASDRGFGEILRV